MATAHRNLIGGSRRSKTSRRGTCASDIDVCNSSERLGTALSSIPEASASQKTREPRTAVAVWDRGELTLQSRTYDVETTIRKIKTLEISVLVTKGLVEALRTGSLSDFSFLEQRPRRPDNGNIASG